MSKKSKRLIRERFLDILLGRQGNDWSWINIETIRVLFAGILTMKVKVARKRRTLINIYMTHISKIYEN